MSQVEVPNWFILHSSVLICLFSQNKWFAFWTGISDILELFLPFEKITYLQSKSTNIYTWMWVLVKVYIEPKFLNYSNLKSCHMKQTSIRLHSAPPLPPTLGSKDPKEKNNEFWSIFMVMSNHDMLRKVSKICVKLFIDFLLKIW